MRKRQPIFEYALLTFVVSVFTLIVAVELFSAIAGLTATVSTWIHG